MFFLNSRRSRHLYFFSLFVLQGLIPGFSLTALFNFLGASGASPSSLGFYFALIGAPWCLQIFAAPFVDRYDQFTMGRRRAWIIFAAIGANLSLIPLLFIANPVTQMMTVAWIFFTHSCFSALMNIACDALIVDRTPESESSTTGAFARSGLSVASALSGILFATTLPQMGFTVSTLVLLFVHAAISIAIFFTRETAEDKFMCWRRRERTDVVRFKLANYASLVAKPNLVWFALSFSTSAFFSILKLSLVTDVLHRKITTDSSLSSFQAAMSLAIGTAGAYASTVLVKRYGAQVMSVIALVTCTLGVAVIGVWKIDSAPVAYGALTLFAMMPTILFIAVLPTLMSLSRGSIAATQFAAFMALMNLGETSGAALFGVLSSQSVTLQTVLGCGFGVLAFGYGLAMKAPRTTGIAAASEPTRNHERNVG